MRHVTWGCFLLAAALGAAACGDDTTETTTGTGTGAGGSGGGSTGAMMTTGNTGGSGGGGMTEELNDCTPATAEDHTSDDSVTIDTMGLAYSPACVRIAKGTSVTINSAFATHPLRAGEIINDSTKVPDDASPIQATDTGTTVTFTFNDAGAFGYYCDVHFSVGMYGAIFVE